MTKDSTLALSESYFTATQHLILPGDLMSASTDNGDVVDRRYSQTQLTQVNITFHTRKEAHGEKQ
jgi:hypothetical protein